jgi:hypothetical protein
MATPSERGINVDPHSILPGVLFLDMAIGECDINGMENFLI